MGILNINDLHKSFGIIKVLDGLTMDVKEGSVFGFIGKNGAGKTTTMRTVLGLIKADGGSITVCGDKVKYGQTATNSVIGYLPDVPAFYGFMRPMEYLKLCGEISGLDNTKIKAKSLELLDVVGLKDNNRKITGFSRGMKQRLGIAQALLVEPKLLICDEPTSALDPAGRKEVLDILSEVKGKTTVVFSTHILSDVERICDTIAVLNNGKIALSGTLSEIKSKHRQDVINIKFDDSAKSNKLSKLLVKMKIESDIDGNDITIKTSNIFKTEKEVLELLSNQNLLPIKLEIAEPTLENLFLEVMQ